MAVRSALRRLLARNGAAGSNDDGRLEQLAARLEQHTVNLAEHQAQLRDEGLRQIINEVRANSAFLADSVVALERAEARRTDLVHALVRPIVHAELAPQADMSHIILVDHIDPVLVEELVAYRHRVTLVDPALDLMLPREVAIHMTPIGSFSGPNQLARLVVWVVRGDATRDALDCIYRWLDRGGACVVATPSAQIGSDRFYVESTTAFAKADDGRYVVSDRDDAAVFVHVLRPSAR